MYVINDCQEHQLKCKQEGMSVLNLRYLGSNVL